MDTTTATKPASKSSTRARTKGIPVVPRTQLSSRRTTRAVRVRQQIALIIGGVATLLVALSVWHLTCAVSVLTGSHFVLALFLAIGIDLGLIASELAELVAHGDGNTAAWARTYMGIATVLSMVLNAYEFAIHAPEGLWTKGIAVAFGILLPAMIFILARIAAKLYENR